MNIDGYPNRELSGVEFTYTQDGDTADGPDYQHLTVKTADAGGGPFLVIATERWALEFEEIDAFADKLRAVVKAIQENQPKRKGKGGES